MGELYGAAQAPAWTLAGRGRHNGCIPRSLSMRIVFLATAAALALAAFPASATDPAVEALLKASGLSYEVDKDGDYTVVVEWDKDGRSQLVYISGSVEDMAGVQVFTAFSPAYVLDAEGGIELALARRLLTENGKFKIGAWETGGKNLYFTTKIPAGISGAQFKTLLLVTAENADDMELELTPGKDTL
jgi:hypothetical protein